MKPAPLPLRTLRPAPDLPRPVPPPVRSARAEAFDRVTGFKALRRRRPGAGRGK